MASSALAAPAPFGELADGPPLQAPASRASAAMAITLAAVRAADGQDWCLTRMLWFIMPFMPAVLRRGG